MIITGVMVRDMRPHDLKRKPATSSLLVCEVLNWIVLLCSQISCSSCSQWKEVVSAFIPEAPRMINIFYHLSIFTTIIHQILLSTVVAADLRCWGAETSTKPLIFRECNEIIVHWIGRTYDSSRRPFDPSLPLTFSRERVPRPDVRTPKAWYDHEAEGSDCLIGVDIPRTPGGTDKTSLHDIKMAAMAIAVECVIKPPHLGGIMQVGWAHKLNVVITNLGGPPNVMARKTDWNSTLEEA